jgi:hypothetical protein
VRVQSISGVGPLVQQTTGIKPRRMHHDISKITGEEVMMFKLLETPQFRENKRK